MLNIHPFPVVYEHLFVTPLSPSLSPSLDAPLIAPLSSAVRSRARAFFRTFVQSHTGLLTRTYLARTPPPMFTYDAPVHTHTAPLTHPSRWSGLCLVSSVTYTHTHKYTYIRTLICIWGLSSAVRSFTSPIRYSVSLSSCSFPLTCRCCVGHHMVGSPFPFAPFAPSPPLLLLRGNRDAAVSICPAPL